MIKRGGGAGVKGGARSLSCQELMVTTLDG